ncbi:MAG: C-GCAxxG-C-C family protein [Deltaproteobacteria bacterium]|nr:C-GCAxxG-C-C family protein [Deltaproteobacteria bacterium]
MIEGNALNAFRKNLRRLEWFLVDYLKESGCCTDVTLAQCHALIEIGEKGGATIMELAQALDLDKSTVSRTVDGLAAEGLILRQIHPSDRRYISVTLTGEGMKLFSKINGANNAFFGTLLDVLEEHQIDVILDHFGILVEALTARRTSLSPPQPCCSSFTGGERPFVGRTPEETAEKAFSLFQSGFCCSESVLMALAEHWNIRSSLIPKAATGFCSGLARTKGTCGAVAGAIMAVNMMTGRNEAHHPRDRNFTAVGSVVEGFIKLFGSINCYDLTGLDLGTEAGRKKITGSGAMENCWRYAREAALLALKAVESDELKGTS